MTYDARKELTEAIDAGERALVSLDDAYQQIKSAKNWGLWDIFGGGFVSGIIKHSKINNASQNMEQAKRDLLIFQREVKDVNNVCNLELDISSFLTFADYFLDGIISDIIVQSKINEAGNQVEEAIEKVNELIKEMKIKLNGVK